MSQAPRSSQIIDRSQAVAASPSSPSRRRAELLHVLMLPDLERAGRIGEFWELPHEPRLRGAANRLRGEPDATGGARRDAQGGGLSFP